MKTGKPGRRGYTLAAACSMAKKTPVVFTCVYDPIAAGAGPSRTNHLPHVSGVSSFPPVEDTVDLIQKLLPGIKAGGTVYNSSEANSVKVVRVARSGLDKHRLASAPALARRCRGTS